MIQSSQFPYPKGNGQVRWVNPAWLKEHLGDRKLMILDCQPNIHDYIQEHIPGARYLNEGVFRIADRSLPAIWIKAGCAAEFLGKAGLDPSVPVVVYSGKGAFKGWGDGLEQTMTAYSLARYGHNNVFVLDGGIDAWKAEGFPVSRELPKFRPRQFPVLTRRTYFVRMDRVIAMKDRPDVLLLDARPSAFYEGQGPWIRPGHIPGSISFPWANLMLPDNKYALKPESEIRAMAAASGITPDKTIICSCGTGREATNEFILFKWFLKYPRVVLFEGAFTEWTAHPGNPIVTGKNPR